MHRVRAADDFEVIRCRLEELRRERERRYGDRAAVEKPQPEPDAEMPRGIVGRYLSQRRHSP